MAKFVSETGNFLGTEDAYEQFTMRTLPLVPFMQERLLTLKEERQENRRLCGRSYIKDYLEYVCVNEIGDLIKPHYVTESFPKLLKAKGMRQIRYHDLRHPYVKQKTKKFAIHFGTGRSVFHSLRPYPSEPLHIVLCVASFPKKSRTA